MIGVLFHGPEVFDSGWAHKILNAISAVDQVRCVLAGTMGRTAVIDSGLRNIECPGTQPSQILRELQSITDSLVFANYAKSEHSGLMHGAMVLERSGIEIPLLQIECSGSCFVEWIEGGNPEVIAVLEKMGLKRKERITLESAMWQKDGKMYRRITTAAAGEFLLVNGIVIGRAQGGDITIECAGRQIVSVSGVEIKPHGIEKLQRLGGVDLRSAKVASTSSIRRMGHAPQVTKVSGKGMVFVDHAGMHLYDLVQNREGAVTVGDDTTAVVGDILYRFQIPLIGITDGDQDTILGDTRFTPGSTVFTVPEDDRTGLRIHSEIFHGRLIIEKDFADVQKRISGLIGQELIRRQDY
jgi:hypothetical protein